MHTVQVIVSEQEVQDILDVLNEYELPANPITLDEVKGNSKLLSYLATEYVEGGGVDPFEIWNADGFNDVAEYR